MSATVVSSLTSAFAPADIGPPRSSAAAALGAFTDAAPPVQLAAEPASGRSALGAIGTVRPAAFADAGRHSQRVRFLRRAIIVVCTSAVGLVSFVLVFDPLHRLKNGLSVGSVGISGTKVTMNDPKLSGVRRDGNAYEVKASTATQDTKVPSKLDLTGVDLRLGQADGSTTRITSQTGRYDTDAERLDLAGAVRFFNEGHYDMRFESAVMDMRGGQITSDRPSVVTIPSGRIEADAVNFSDEKNIVAFTGNVRSVFTSADDAADEGAKR